MKIVDNGVLSPSFMDFTIPSEFARKALFHIPQFGYFHCNQEYRVSREFLDQFLLIYVHAGALCVHAQGKQLTARQDEVILLDCRAPHTYFCENTVQFSWFHFQGNVSAQYVSHLIGQFGMSFSGEHVQRLKKSFEIILSSAQTTPVNEHQISLQIHQILTELATREKHAAMSELLVPTISYISQNFDKTIDLDQMSGLCNMSTSHFIRMFKKHLGCTPHEYLLAYRIRQAKLSLLTSSVSIEQIAEQCGFHSASHFARAFRKSCGISPSEFRAIPF